MSQITNQKQRANRALDAANFFLADVRDGLGPYLAIYLLTEQKWNEARIGMVMSIAGFAGILAQTPAGALVDATRAKRLVMVAAALLVTLASVLLPLFPSFWPIAISQGIAHTAGVIFPPAIAAVSLGVVGPHIFAKRIGRNETFNHAGNATAAAIAGLAAYLFGPTVVFYLLAVMSVASIASLLAIPESAIDHDRARGLHEVGLQARPGAGQDREQPSGLSVLFTCRPLLIFAVCVTLFHLSNAAMLPLVGQKLALQDTRLGTSLMSACIIAAQIVMVPMAILVGAKADDWGHKRFFSPRFSSSRSAARFTPSLTILPGSSECNFSTALEPVFSGRSFLSSSPISCATPDASTWRKERSSPRRASAQRSRRQLRDWSPSGLATAQLSSH